MKLLNVYSQQKRYRLEFVYDEEAKDNLKEIINWPIRDYDPELKVWYVNKIVGIENTLQRWAERYFKKSILHIREGDVDCQYDFITMKKECEQHNLFSV